MSYQYDSEFFEFVNGSAGRSATRFIDVLQRTLFKERAAPASVIDIGCGQGVWAAEWRRRGVQVMGVDGAYVSAERLLIPPSSFVAADLSKPFSAGMRFGLVLCLEVAEHLPPEAADILVASIVAHGDVVIFSAAVPGQGGEFHVNERPYAYWRRKFAAHGYLLYDALRPLLKSDEGIEPWYRYNTFVFANASGAELLASTVTAGLVPAEGAIANVAPLSWRLRCFLVAHLPKSLTHSLARMKHRWVNRTGRDRRLADLGS